MGHGGRRPGAGRPKKDRAAQAFFEDAESYLLAVVQGCTIPDAVRVAAAKALIQYQKAKARTPMKSPSSSQLRRKTETDLEKSKIQEFETKAAKVRKKYSKGGTK